MTCQIKNNLDPDSLYKVMLEIQAARTSTNSWAKTLRLAIQANDKATEVEARNRLLFSKEAILTAALEANRKLRPEKRKSLEYCLDLPKKLDFSKPFPEIVRVRAKVKKPMIPGTPVAFRVLHDHNICHRTAQHTVMRVLGPYFVPRAFQYTHLGVQAVIAHTKSLIKAGYIYATRLDIIDFYKSFSADALIIELPLPKEVVENAVMGRHMQVVMDQGNDNGKHTLYSPHTIEHLLLQARQGIPLGAASSPIVGMICISRLAWSQVPDVALLNYVDDFQLLARTPQALEKAIGKLTKAVSELPGGHFKLLAKSKGSAATGFDLLGHRFHLVSGAVHVKPTEANQEYITGRLNILDDKFGPACFDKKIDLVTQQYSLAKSWAAAFSECDGGVTRWLATLMIYIENNAKAVGLSLDQLEKEIEPWMGYKPDDYALGL